MAKAGPIRRLWQPIKRAVSRALGPRVVWGFVDRAGIYLPNTRVSNQCAISGIGALDIGDHVFIGHFSVIDAACGLSIGEGTQISSSTSIFTHSSHVAIRLYGRNYAHTDGKEAYGTAPVRIGAYCFVGAHAVVLPGSIVGRGSVVAAQSVVRGEFPEFAIIMGAPARQVGDTRELDKTFLDEHPQLHPSYFQWAGPASGGSA
jgi:acetyltransferase-like isoleucine patch superfamily enzyme